ncbi:hypothetical protein MY10362_002756 [Beauveria mimosiformis]
MTHALKLVRQRQRRVSRRDTLNHIHHQAPCLCIHRARSLVEYQDPTRAPPAYVGDDARAELLYEAQRLRISIPPREGQSNGGSFVPSFSSSRGMVCSNVRSLAIAPSDVSSCVQVCD